MLLTVSASQKEIHFKTNSQVPSSEKRSSLKAAAPGSTRSFARQRNCQQAGERSDKHSNALPKRFDVFPGKVCFAQRLEIGFDFLLDPFELAAHNLFELVARLVPIMFFKNASNHPDVFGHQFALGPSQILIALLGPSSQVLPVLGVCPANFIEAEVFKQGFIVFPSPGLNSLGFAMPDHLFNNAITAWRNSDETTVASVPSFARNHQYASHRHSISTTDLATRSCARDSWIRSLE